MGTKASTPGNVISLPQGGGALHGMGETFSPDLHTGTGNFSVPLALPPGRNGFQPQLSLAYSTGNGNGPFGLGWALSVPGVTRKTSQGIPQYHDSPTATDPDVFILSGAEDLVPIPQPGGPTLYRPRTEGLFARITHYQDASGNYWEVRSKDGLVSYYGTPKPSGAPPTWQDPAVITDLDQPDHIFSWKLTRTVDPFGNRIEYTYIAADTESPQLYLQEIRYADYTDPAENQQFLVSVRFVYETRPDPFTSHRAGFAIPTRSRCPRIEIWTHPGTDLLVRQYQLAYLDERPQLLPLNGVSLLHQIQVLGPQNEKELEKELPPLEFSYTEFTPQTQQFAPVTGSQMPAGSLARPEYELADVLGIGLPAVLEMDGAVRYWRNLGNCQLDLPHSMAAAPAGVTLADPGVQLIDADGNGRLDLLVTAAPLTGYYPLADDGRWARFQPYKSAPSFSLKDPEVRLVDLNGDGVTDAIRSSTRLECFFNDPPTGWSATNTRWVSRQALANFPNVNFSDPRVKWADMTGDQLQDIVLIYNGSVVYWPNQGWGNWDAPVQMRNAPDLPWGYDPKRILLGDVDGDGAADFVYVEDDRVTLWINQSGNGWSAPIVIDGTPAVSDMDAVRLVDLLGTGVSGLLWSRDASAPGRPTMFFLDFTGGVKPYLLNQMDNHIGAVTAVEYAPSTRFYLADEQVSATRWQTTLPFPVQVVAQVTVTDVFSRSALTTVYRYHHGYWDGTEREFRGFGMVEQHDSQTFAAYNQFASGGATSNTNPIPAEQFSPPTLTKTWFHQGPVGSESDWKELNLSAEYWADDTPQLPRAASTTTWLASLPRRVQRDAVRALRGTILRTEFYALDGKLPLQDRPYTVSEQRYDILEIDPSQQAGSTRVRIFFAPVTVGRTTQWERGDDPLTQYNFTDGYDQYGRPHWQTTVGLPRRSARRNTTPASVVVSRPLDETRILATHVRTAYAEPDLARSGDLYMHDRVAEVHSFELQTAPGTDGVEETRPNDLPQVLADQAAAAEDTHQHFAWDDSQPPPADVALIGHIRNHYDGDAFVGGPVGEIGRYGALTRTEALAFRDAELDAAYESRRPVYLDGTAPLPVGTPADFPNMTGYAKEQAADAGGKATYYYCDTQRRKYDFQDPLEILIRGLVIGVQDALHRQTDITIDSYGLFPTVVKNAAGLTTTADYDYQVMRPSRVTDPNGNATCFSYTPLGLLKIQYLQSRDGQSGTPTEPEIRFVYDFLAYDNTRSQQNPQPIFVHQVSRIHHASEGISDETIEARQYSDGFGRLLQTRNQAESLVFGESAGDGSDIPRGDDVGLDLAPGVVQGPAKGHLLPAGMAHVTVSGWQIYDNKGRVVEKYEPFFAVGWPYQLPSEEENGQHATLYYDPRGQLIRTRNPDGSEQRVVLGIPRALDAPDDFAPTPWEQYTYDANDLAPLSGDPQGQSLAASAPAAHYYTPTSTVVDVLGRTVAQSTRNGPTPAQDWYLTRSAYDTRGNLLQITDTLGRPAFQYAYDLLNRQLRVLSIDAGLRTTVLNATSNPIEYRDSKGSIVLRLYDQLNRLKALWAKDDTNGTFTQREQLVYGDDAAPGIWMQEQAANRLGRLAQHYDEAGLLECRQYDFKGNLTEKTRRVISDDALKTTWQADWSRATAADDLEGTEYTISTRFDALNRPVMMQYPTDVTGVRAALTPSYNRAGALEKVDLDGTPYVTQIAYNAKGQRVLVAYGNSIMTRYAYDLATFRLVRLRTERCVDPAPPDATWVADGGIQQEFTYTYDLVGNILGIEDQTPHSGIARYDRDRLLRQFAYDPVYRLTQASGRACKGFATAPPFEDQLRCGGYTAGQPVPNQDNAPDLVEPYSESYSYDPAGNMLNRTYESNNPGSPRMVTTFGIGGQDPADWSEAPNNRLTSLEQGGVKNQFAYDDNGNMKKQNSDRRYTWDHANRLIGYTNQPSGPPSVEARYLYGADGLRVKKWVRTNGMGEGESTVYIDGLFEHHTWPETGNPHSKENNYLHVLDSQQRIALVRRGPASNKDAGPAIQYHFADHLGSSNVVASASGAWINREEYFPYGETSFGSFARKRYRHSGKERDEESGLYNYGARYYIPSLARWLSPDPLGSRDGLNQYWYVHDNPSTFIDPNGQLTGSFIGQCHEGGDDGVPLKIDVSPLANIDKLSDKPTLRAGTIDDLTTKNSITLEEWQAQQEEYDRKVSADLAALATNIFATAAMLGAAAAGRSDHLHERIMFGANLGDFALALAGVASAKAYNESVGRSLQSDPQTTGMSQSLDPDRAANTTAADEAMASHIGAGGRATITSVNPSGRWDNCTACVAAHMINDATGSELTANQIENKFGYAGMARQFKEQDSISYLENATGWTAKKAPFLAPDAEPGYYAIILGQPRLREHVIYGKIEILEGGKRVIDIWDPQIEKSYTPTQLANMVNALGGVSYRFAPR